MVLVVEQCSVRYVDMIDLLLQQLHRLVIVRNYRPDTKKG